MSCCLRMEQQVCVIPVNYEQRWRSGCAFASHAGLPPMWPGFDSRSRRQMWVEFVVGSRPCSERFFFGYFGFLLSSKTNIIQIPTFKGISLCCVFLAIVRCKLNKVIKFFKYSKQIYLVCYPVYWNWMSRTQLH